MKNATMIKRFFSYFFPITEKVISEYNGVLELTLINGRKVLDSKNANYSFGSLQRILEQGLSKIEWNKVSSVLLLGLGGGSVIKSLTDKFGYKGNICAVEIDSVIIDIAKNEYDIQESDNLHIFNLDAWEYLTSCSSFFDLIIVDLFIDNQVPSKFYSQDFCEKLIKRLSKTGCILFNIGIESNGLKERKKTIDYFVGNSNLSCTLYEKVEGTNSILVIKNYH